MPAALSLSHDGTSHQALLVPVPSSYEAVFSQGRTVLCQKTCLTKHSSGRRWRRVVAAAGRKSGFVFPILGFALDQAHVKVGTDITNDLGRAGVGGPLKTNAGPDAHSRRTQLYRAAAMDWRNSIRLAARNVTPITSTVANSFHTIAKSAPR